MNQVTIEELIQKATSVIHARNIDEYNTIGQVGCALVTDKGNVYTGVCIDTSSGMGFCAEASAIAAMVTAGENKVIKIVATWKDGNNVYVVSPCGRCREFITKFDKDNVNAYVILSKDTAVKLSELLPHANEYNEV